MKQDAAEMGELFFMVVVAILASIAETIAIIGVASFLVWCAITATGREKPMLDIVMWGACLALVFNMVRTMR